MENNEDKTETHFVLTKDTVVGHYRIVERIGAGGMGEVYLAQDMELDRKVALKFLSHHLCQDEECRKRFKREAQAAAKLSHPNIVTIHEVGECQSRPYFAMEHIDGKPLKEFIEEGALSVEFVIDVAGQLCDALSKAHQKGILHRDIKPSNIIVDQERRVRLLDFKLATVQFGEKLTKTGSTLGTVGYMAPEHIEGKETDQRADLFSLGVVLYEMMAGKRPFTGSNEAATLKSVLHTKPEPLARFKRDTPPDLERIVSKLLQKDPGLRYQTAGGVLSDLKGLVAAGEVQDEDKGDWWNKYVVTGAALVLAVMATYWLFCQEEREMTLPVEETSNMIAVLPFGNLGDPEDEYFADGMTEEIISRLASVHSLGVISRTSSMQYKQTDKNIKEIGAELGVDYVLEGTVRWDKSGETSQVRINPQLINVENDIHLWADRYDVVIDDIFDVQSEIAERVTSELNVALLESERKSLQAHPTNNMEAYNDFLKGLGYFNEHTPMDYINAEMMLSRAISLEPDFARAHAWLSVVHTQVYFWYIDRSESRLSAAKNAVDRALELKPDLSDAAGALAWYHYAALGEDDLALAEFRELRKKEPNDYMVQLCIAGIERRQGKWEKAVRDYESALRLNPRSALLSSEFGVALLYLRRFAEADSLFRRAIEFAAGPAVRISESGSGSHPLGR